MLRAGVSGALYTMNYYQDDLITLYHGDALAVARELESRSVNCIVTSPPYFGLRDYGTAGQYGAESTIHEYIETMANLFIELQRVLTNDGTLWLNLGDSYSSGGRKTSIDSGLNKGRGTPQYRPTSDRPGKNLLGIPWRVAFALQDAGWILRNEVIWAKTNGMPESVTDRLTSKHEHVFLFAKSERYIFNLDAIREGSPITAESQSELVPITQGERIRKQRASYAAPGQSPNMRTIAPTNPNGGNPGDVWSINTRPFTEAHFAVMPPELARRAIVAGCKEGGVVLDPFSGSGTTGKVALDTGRRYVGIDISSDYLDLSLRTRFLQPPLIGI